MSEGRDLRGDIFGGVTAGVVALPLALAFGEASGAGPIAGLWGVIIVGFLAAIFGGTATQVSGPGAGATMRTVINIRSGGSSRISGAVHSVLLLTVVLVLGPVASQIPQAVLAGILVKVGWDILDLKFVTQARRGPRWDLLLMVLVLGLTVFVDLITAVAVGVVLASLSFVSQLADQQLGDLDATGRPNSDEEQRLLDAADGRVSVFEFGGPLSFGAATDLAHRAQEGVGAHTEIILLDFGRVPYLDASAARAISTISAYADEGNIAVMAAGLNESSKEVLAAFDADGGFAEVHPTREEALASAVGRIGVS